MDSKVRTCHRMTKKIEVVIGNNLERAGEENYFYVKPGGDASVVIQAAIDYVETLQISQGAVADPEIWGPWTISEDKIDRPQSSGETLNSLEIQGKKVNKKA